MLVINLFIYMRVIYIVHTIKVSECVNEKEVQTDELNYVLYIRTNGI